MLDYETRLEENYDIVRYEYEQELIEHGYAPHLVDEINDGRDEFIEKEYDLYITNLT